MNAPAYINNAHKALVRNPGGLTLEELSGKLRAKALKVSQQIRELHDAGLIETVEEAGQPVYKLKAAPVAESAENGRADIPPPQYDPASVAFPAADAAIPTKTYGPSVLRAIISELSGDSEGGETDAPAVADGIPKYGHGLSCGACHDGCAGEQCQVERDSPPIDWPATEDYEMPPADPVLLASANRMLCNRLEAVAEAIRASTIPSLEGIAGAEDLAPHVKTLCDALAASESTTTARGHTINQLRLEVADLRERLDAQIKQWQADTGRLTSDLRAATESRSQAINEADRLRAELATERQAREAPQEQSDEVDVKDAAVGYLVRVPKRAPIMRRKPESARSAALSAVRSGAARAEVLAVVPVGTARRGAEWKSTEAGG